MKTKTKTKTKTKCYVHISTGVYKTSSGNYRVRRTVDGTKYDKTFTNLRTANKWFNQLVK